MIQRCLSDGVCTFFTVVKLLEELSSKDDKENSLWRVENLALDERLQSLPLAVLLMLPTQCLPL